MKYIPLCGTAGRGKSIAVDDEHYDILSTFSWRMEGRGMYAHASVYIRRFNGRQISVVLSLHRTIMVLILNRSLLRGELVDHRHGDLLNCTSSELRLADHVGSSANRSKQRVNRGKHPSSYKGVSYQQGPKRKSGGNYELKKPWRVQIFVKYKAINVGWFATEEEAALAYNEAALHHHGDFARLNTIQNHASFHPYTRTAQ